MRGCVRRRAAAGEQLQAAPLRQGAQRTEVHGELAAQLVIQQHGLLLHAPLLLGRRIFVVAVVLGFPVVVAALLVLLAAAGAERRGTAASLSARTYWLWARLSARPGRGAAIRGLCSTAVARVGGAMCPPAAALGLPRRLSPHVLLLELRLRQPSASQEPRGGAARRGPRHLPALTSVRADPPARAARCARSCASSSCSSSLAISARPGAQGLHWLCSALKWRSGRCRRRDRSWIGSGCERAGEWRSSWGAPVRSDVGARC
jgi:hypothetical protein